MSIDNMESNYNHADRNQSLESQQEKSEKQKQWESLEAEIDQITDGLGQEIDFGIRQAVVAFKAHEFSTNQSCEGHLEGKHGNPYPWVEVYAPEPEGWKENEEKQKEWHQENLKEQHKMLTLLSDFYQNRNIPLDAQLTFDKIGAFGGFRVQSMGADTMELLSEIELKEKYELYKNEMEDFSEFLKRKFFSA